MHCAGSNLLPYEILSIIVRELGGSTSSTSTNDKHSYETALHSEDLHSCLFVSTTFRRLALRYLYRRIRITNTGKFRGRSARAKRISLLNEVLSFPWNDQADRVAQHIKSVSLWYRGRHRDDDTQLHAFFADKDLLSVLQTLSREEYGLHQLAISLLKKNHGVTNWMDLPVEFRAPFKVLITLPSLTSFYAQDIHDIPAHFLRGTHLKRLHMDRSLYFRPNRHVSASSETESNLNALPYPPLQDLTIKHSYHFDDSHASPLRSLRNLVVHNDTYNADTRNLMKIARNTLENVEIHTDMCRRMFPQSLMLDEMLNLKTLLYSFDLTCWEDLQPMGLINVFNVSTPVPHLESIELRFHSISVEDHNIREDFMLPLLNLCFENTSLDRLWCSSMYPSLRYVKIIIKFQMSEYDYRFDGEMVEKLVEETTKSAFPGLVLSKKVFFEPKIYFTILVRH